MQSLQRGSLALGSAITVPGMSLRCWRLASALGCRRHGSSSPAASRVSRRFTASAAAQSEQRENDAPPAASSPPPALSSNSSPRFEEGQLTRDFISASLYSSAGGYFNTRQRIHSAAAASALDFPSLRGRDGYYQQLSELYKQLDNCWLTPVEIFKPHYARAIARWLLQRREAASSSPLRVVEVGGGNGTCAAGILDYLRELHPAVYAQTHYSIVELSQVNHERQRAALAQHMPQHVPQQSAATAAASSASSASSSSSSSSSSATSSAAASSPLGLPRVDLLCMSMLDWAEVVRGEVFVLCLEVLDNMPHDKVEAMGGEDGLQQTHVFSLTADTRQHRLVSDTALVHPMQQYREAFSPVTDPFILEYLHAMDEYRAVRAAPRWHRYGTSNNYLAVGMQALGSLVHRLLAALSPSQLPQYLPTTALHFFHLLHHFMPQHRLLVGDFSSLPDAITGVNAPVVSSSDQQRGGVRDYRTYLLQLGCADIFFPSDFELMQFVYHRVGRIRRSKDGARVGGGAAGIEAAAEEGKDGQSGITSRVLTNYEFMREYAVDAAKQEWQQQETAAAEAGSMQAQPGSWRSPTRTRSRFDPLLHDYVNFKFLVT